MTSTAVDLSDLRALDDALRILRAVKKELAPGSTTIWRIVDHACEHLEEQLNLEISEQLTLDPHVTTLVNPAR
jgi:hypothetical protein